MLRGTRGLTLIELLIAGVIALVVIIGIIVMDVGRIRLRNVLVETSKQAGEEQQMGMAAVLLGKDIEQADRVNIRNTGAGGGAGDVQIRIPVGCMANPLPACFDIAANYQWIEYKRVGNELWRYEPGCAGRVLARQLGGTTPSNQGFQIAYRNTVVPAAWGVATDERNVLQYWLTWNNGLGAPFEKEHTFTGTSTMRAFGYMNVNRGIANAAGDSGTGLAPSTIPTPDLVPPPGGC